MSDASNKDITPEEVIAHMSESLPGNTCIANCTSRYRDELQRCNGDRECITRATGRYVLCVLGCLRK